VGEKYDALALFASLVITYRGGHGLPFSVFTCAGIVRIVVIAYTRAVFE
jgi:hypothetical protein